VAVRGSVAVLQANLGAFDTPVDPVNQTVPFTFHRWTDEDFPPITGLTPRLQYRIPKLFGWEMFPGYDYYLWLDGTVSLKREDCLEWYLDQLGDKDMAFFAHPNRHSIKEEVEHLDDFLTLKKGTKRGQNYLLDRYKNGLHKEQYAIIKNDQYYRDDKLYASTVFIYRNSPRVQSMLREWWFYQSRYFTCDQVVLPWLLDNWKVKVKTLDEPIYKSGYISLVSHHK
jgi:hypothetical protein